MSLLYQSLGQNQIQHQLNKIYANQGEIDQAIALAGLEKSLARAEKRLKRGH